MYHGSKGFSLAHGVPKALSLNGEDYGNIRIVLVSLPPFFSAYWFLSI